MGSRRLVRWARYLCFLAALPVSAFADFHLFVYYSTLARPSAIQKMLDEHCRGIQVTVFGRLDDFHAMVSEQKPDAILTIPEVVEGLKGYEPKLKGGHHGSDRDSSLLVGLEPASSPGAAAAVVGLVGSLDREKEEAALRAYIPGSPRFRRVTKVEDLLPLLLFRSVTGIVVTHETLEQFRKRSETKLVVSMEWPSSTGLITLAVRKGQPDAPFISAMRTLDAKGLEMLGIDRWK